MKNLLDSKKCPQRMCKSSHPPKIQSHIQRQPKKGSANQDISCTWSATYISDRPCFEDPQSDGFQAEFSEPEMRQTKSVAVAGRERINNQWGLERKKL